MSLRRSALTTLVVVVVALVIAVPLGVIYLNGEFPGFTGGYNVSRSGSTNYMTANFLSNGTLQIPPNFSGSSRTGLPGSAFSYLNTSLSGSSFHSGGSSNHTVVFHINVTVNGALNSSMGFTELSFKPNFSGQNQTQDRLTELQSDNMKTSNLTTNYKVGSTGDTGGTWYLPKTSGNLPEHYVKFDLVMSYTVVVPYIQPGHSFNLTFTYTISSPSNQVSSSMTLDVGDENIAGISQNPV